MHIPHSITERKQPKELQIIGRINATKYLKCIVTLVRLNRNCFWNDKRKNATEYSNATRKLVTRVCGINLPILK